MPEVDDKDAADRNAALRAFGVVAEACAAALVNEPSERVVAALAQVGAALGDDRFAGIEPGPDLTQRYYDRFFVSSTPYYVPLIESAVVKRIEEDGRVRRYGSLSSSRGDHVLRCYKAVGFDFQAIEGYAPTVAALRADSMASELAFMAQLAYAASDHAGTDEGAHAERLLGEFARLHARWFADAALCLARSADDLYARLAALAADAVAFLLDDGAGPA